MLVVGDLVGRRLPKLYGLWQGFVNLEGSPWPLLPDSTRAAAIEIGVVHFAYAFPFLSGEINLLEQKRRRTDRKREVLRLG